MNHITIAMFCEMFMDLCSYHSKKGKVWAWLEFLLLFWEELEMSKEREKYNDNHNLCLPSLLPVRD